MAGAALHGARLDAVLRGWLPEATGQPLSHGALRRLIVAGAICIDGRAERRPAASVRQGARLLASLRLDLLARASLPRDVEFRFGPGQILYEDAALIAVDKPPGLPTQPTADPQRPHLVGLLTAFLEARDGAPAYLGSHQRLDRDTSGVVLFTRDPAANPGLAALFEQRRLEKTYRALVAVDTAPPPAAWRVANRLGASGKGRHARVVQVTRGGDAAVTEFRRLECFARGALVEARPGSGRKHQIRVHLADSGWPILGDERYGDPRRAARLMLHAAGLTLRHPLTGAPLRIESPDPPDFKRALHALAAAAAARSRQR